MHIKTSLSLSKRFLGLTLLTLCLAQPALAQASSPPDTAILREYSETRGYQLGRPQKAKFSRDGQAALFLRSLAKNKVQSLFEMDIKTGRVRELASPEALLKGQIETVSPEEKDRRERLRLQADGISDYFPHPREETILIPLSGQLFLLNRKTGTSELLPIKGPVIDPQWSPNGTKIAYVRGYDVYVYDFEKAAEQRVTQGGTIEVTL